MKRIASAALAIVATLGLILPATLAQAQAQKVATSTQTSRLQIGTYIANDVKGKVKDGSVRTYQNVLEIFSLSPDGTTGTARFTVNRWGPNFYNMRNPTYPGVSVKIDGVGVTISFNNVTSDRSYSFSVKGTLRGNEIFVPGGQNLVKDFVHPDDQVFKLQ